MNYRPMVKVYGSDKFCGNALVFATYEEAYGNAVDLMNRWMAVEDVSVEETDLPVNYRYSNGRTEAVEG